jgi:hypothetical protein
MPRGCEPSARDFLEALFRYARMGGESQFKQRLFAEPKERIVIVFEHRLERLTLDHCRVFGRQLLDAAEGEKELRLKRLFTAESAIVVERGDALG